MPEMLKAGIHFGHQRRYWNPKMAEYIFGSRNRIHIFNLDKTRKALEAALADIRKRASRGETILFVGTKRAAREAVREHALRCDMPYVDHHWLGGTLTNYKIIRQSVRRLIDMSAAQDPEKPEQTNLTKMEALLQQRKMNKLEKRVGGIRGMNGLPNLLFVIDVHYESISVSEAQKLSIPIVAIVDSDSDPREIDHVIPGNDDSIRAVQLYCSTVADAIIAGKEDARNSANQQPDA